MQEMEEDELNRVKGQARELASRDKQAGAAFLSSLHPLLKNYEQTVQKQLVTEYRRAWGEDAPTLIGW